VVLPSHLPCQVADRLTATHGPDDLRAALDLLLDDRSTLIDWLRSVCDHGRLAPVVAASYWHPNGFAKLVLHASPDFTIRLHVWPSGEKRLGEGDPHSHRWDFASTVLVGGGLQIVESVELLEPNSSSDMECVRHIYDGYRLIPDTKVFLRHGEPITLLADDIYTTETTTIHTVAPNGDDLVATLLVQGPHIKPATAVYGLDLADGENPLGRTIDADEVCELLSTVVATLDEKRIER
jgi:hypothetical protein